MNIKNRWHPVKNHMAVRTVSNCFK